MSATSCPATLGELRCLKPHGHDGLHLDNHDGDPIIWFPPAATEPDPGGAWIVYDWDMNAYPISLHPNELDARRKSDELGYGKVKFWAWGEWENR